jgi:hypothetical protein
VGTGAGLGVHVVSPDGTKVAAQGSAGIGIYPLDGGPVRRISGMEVNDQLVQWSADGRSLFVLRGREPAAKVFRVEIETGKATLWKEIQFADPAGVTSIYALQISRDEKSYFYTVQRKMSDLYVVEGLR